jgi:hypothetical protein
MRCLLLQPYMWHGRLQPPPACGATSHRDGGRGELAVNAARLPAAAIERGAIEVAPPPRPIPPPSAILFEQAVAMIEPNRKKKETRAEWASEIWRTIIGRPTGASQHPHRRVV